MSSLDEYLTLYETTQQQKAVTTGNPAHRFHLTAHAKGHIRSGGHAARPHSMSATSNIHSIDENDDGGVTNRSHRSFSQHSSRLASARSASVRPGSGPGATIAPKRTGTSSPASLRSNYQATKSQLLSSATKPRKSLLVRNEKGAFQRRSSAASSTASSATSAAIKRASINSGSFSPSTQNNPYEAAARANMTSPQHGHDPRSPSRAHSIGVSFMSPNQRHITQPSSSPFSPSSHGQPQPAYSPARVVNGHEIPFGSDYIPKRPAVSPSPPLHQQLFNPAEEWNVESHERLFSPVRPTVNALAFTGVRPLPQSEPAAMLSPLTNQWMSTLRARAQRMNNLQTAISSSSSILTPPHSVPPTPYSPTIPSDRPHRDALGNLLLSPLRDCGLSLTSTPGTQSLDASRNVSPTYQPSASKIASAKHTILGSVGTGQLRELLTEFRQGLKEMHINSTQPPTTAPTLTSFDLPELPMPLPHELTRTPPRRQTLEGEKYSSPQPVISHATIATSPIPQPRSSPIKSSPRHDHVTVAPAPASLHSPRPPPLTPAQRQAKILAELDQAKENITTSLREHASTVSRRDIQTSPSPPAAAIPPMTPPPKHTVEIGTLTSPIRSSQKSQPPTSTLIAPLNEVPIFDRVQASMQEVHNINQRANAAIAAAQSPAKLRSPQPHSGPMANRQVLARIDNLMNQAKRPAQSTTQSIVKINSPVSRSHALSPQSSYLNLPTPAALRDNERKYDENDLSTSQSHPISGLTQSFLSSQSNSSIASPNNRSMRDQTRNPTHHSFQLVSSPIPSFHDLSQTMPLPHPSPYQHSDDISRALSASLRNIQELRQTLSSSRERVHHNLNHSHEHHPQSMQQHQYQQMNQPIPMAQENMINLHFAMPPSTATNIVVAPVFDTVLDRRYSEAELQLQRPSTGFPWHFKGGAFDQKQVESKSFLSQLNHQRRASIATTVSATDSNTPTRSTHSSCHTTPPSPTSTSTNNVMNHSISSTSTMNNTSTHLPMTPFTPIQPSNIFARALTSMPLHQTPAITNAHQPKQSNPLITAHNHINLNLHQRSHGHGPPNLVNMNMATLARLNNKQ